mmetsp:Transcript_32114/g.76332  ORF Transcript_32114/g.76332 Transcript_32114/m.76332 type:complete len:281 (-) Transcript_32114:262-1104(-)
MKLDEELQRLKQQCSDMEAMHSSCCKEYESRIEDLQAKLATEQASFQKHKQAAWELQQKLGEQQADVKEALELVLSRRSHGRPQETWTTSQLAQRISQHLQASPIRSAPSWPSQRAAPGSKPQDAFRQNAAGLSAGNASPPTQVHHSSPAGEAARDFSTAIGACGGQHSSWSACPSFPNSLRTSFPAAADPTVDGPRHAFRSSVGSLERRPSEAPLRSCRDPWPPKQHAGPFQGRATANDELTRSVGGIDVTRMRQEMQSLDSEIEGLAQSLKEAAEKFI